MIVRRSTVGLVATALWAFLSSAALAQTCPVQNSTPQFTAGGSVFGFLSSQWNAFFAAKVDANNGVLCNPTIIGGTGTPVLGPSTSVDGDIALFNGLTGNRLKDSGIASTMGGLTLNPTPASTAQAINSTQSGPTLVSGLSGGFHYNDDSTITDNTAVNATYGTFGHVWSMITGGVNENGQVTNGFFGLSHTIASASNHDQTALLAEAIYYASDTSVTLAGPYGLVGSGRVENGASVGVVAGEELDSGICATCSANYRYNFLTANYDANVAGTLDSDWVATNAIAGGAHKALITLSTLYGFAPVAATGSLITADSAQTIQNLIQLPNETISGLIINTPGAQLFGNGDLVLGGSLSVASSAIPKTLNSLTANLTGQTFYADFYPGLVSGVQCTWDATHDVGDCINAAIAAAYNGGTVLGRVSIPAGVFGQTVTVAQTTPVGIDIVGAGGDANFGVCITTLKWIGASAAKMMSYIPSGQNIVGGLPSHMCLDGNNGLAATGVYARGVNNAWSEDFAVTNTSAAGWDIDAVDGTNGQFSQNFFVNDNIFLIGSGATTANGWQIGQGATTTGNDAYDNHWIGGLVQYKNGIGFVCGAADGNHIDGMDIQTISGGTGVSIDMRGSSLRSELACRAGNRFVTTAGFGRGAGTAPTAETATYPSTGNYVYQVLDSGGLLPVVLGSATLGYDTNYGDHFDNRANSTTNWQQGGMTYKAGGGANHAVFDIDTANTSNFSEAAKFGPTLPIYLLYNNPTIGRNLYFGADSAWHFGKGSVSKFGGLDQFDATLNLWKWAATTASGNADAAATLTPTWLTLDGNNGHVRTGGTAPGLSSCGTGSPTINGTDLSGTVTLGTSATACTITFANAYVAAPHCAVTWRGLLASETYTVSNTAITLGQTSTSGDLVDYICIAPAGG